MAKIRRATAISHSRMARRWTSEVSARVID
jgi:hypothetical protein